MMKKSNKLKCKYCDYTIPRWKGPGKPNSDKMLFQHTTAVHEKEFLESMKFTGTLEEYLDYLDNYPMEREEC